MRTSLSIHGSFLGMKEAAISFLASRTIKIDKLVCKCVEMIPFFFRWKGKNCRKINGVTSFCSTCLSCPFFDALFQLPLHQSLFFFVCGGIWRLERSPPFIYENIVARPCIAASQRYSETECKALTRPGWAMMPCSSIQGGQLNKSISRRKNGGGEEETLL